MTEHPLTREQGKNLWTVELWNDVTKEWEPTVGVALSRETGREVLAEWKADLRDDKLRLHPYRAVQP